MDDDSQNMATMDDEAQRLGARDSLLLTAQLKIGDDPEAQSVRVRNLSSGGLMAEYPGHVMDGQSITIEVRGVGWVRGRIAWATDGRIGIAFDKPINPMLARKPVGGPQRPAPPPRR